MREPHQAADTVLMLRPAAFGFNTETSASNVFQQHDARDASAVARLARAEFGVFERALTQAGVRVVVYDDTAEPRKPDAVFVNNWITTHRSGDLVLYPMQAPTRRLEVRRELADALAVEYGFARIHDLTDPATLGGVLEGTGSLVFDRAARVAYACLSPRTERAAVIELCRLLRYEAIIFTAAVTNRPIYHTNVVLSVGSDFALVCLAAFTSAREEVVARLEATGHEVRPISSQAMRGFAANVLERRSKQGERLLAGSARALESLPSAARDALAARLSFVTAPLPTIEFYGGGSARCMIAEVYAPDTASA